MTELFQKLNYIQCNLVAPKSNYNSFGKYHYRSCEDILNALKGILKEQGVTVTLSDEIIPIGNRVYVKATATISDGKDSHSVTAYAREDETKKGMDGSQVTGASSSYARKYALNGLFAIDDTKDADATNTHGNDASQSSSKAAPQTNELETAMAEVRKAKTVNEISSIWVKWSKFNKDAGFKSLCTQRKEEINNAKSAQ